jgi:D-3-phosphoglycerate dehydrogenase
MTQRLSLARDKIRVLLLEGVNQSGVDLITESGYTNVTLLPKALDGEALREAVRGVHLIGIRSRTQLTDAVLDAADRLLAIGCFSVGTNQVDIDSARRRGIPVFNAPFSNTRSVAELVIGEIVMLLRRIFAKSVAAHAGRWDKSSAASYEVRGKTLGIVGYGNIGSQLSNLAEAMGMRVIFFDLTDKLRHGNTEPVESLMDLLAMSHIVSLHVPETPRTHRMIGETEIRAMRKGAILINNSRGTVVDLDALAAALRDGHIGGAAVDVFPVEPSSNAEAFVTPLQGLDNMILTPHVGGSTEEAQERIGAEVARKLIEYSDVGSTIVPSTFRRCSCRRGRPAPASSRSSATYPACLAASTTSLRGAASISRPSTIKPTARSAMWCWKPTMSATRPPPSWRRSARSRVRSARGCCTRRREKTTHLSQPRQF